MAELVNSMNQSTFEGCFLTEDKVFMGGRGRATVWKERDVVMQVIQKSKERQGERLRRRCSTVN